MFNMYVAHFKQWPNDLRDENVQTEGNILENDSAVQNLQSCQENIDAYLLKISKVGFVSI